MQYSWLLQSRYCPASCCQGKSQLSFKLMPDVLPKGIQWPKSKNQSQTYRPKCIINPLLEKYIGFFRMICYMVNSSQQKTNRCPTRTQTRGGIKLLQVADPSSPRILPTEAAILTDATIVALKLLMEWDHTLFIGHPTRFFSHPAARSSRRRCPDGKTKTRFLPNEGNCYPGPVISYLMISPPIFLGVLTCTASRCCVQSK